MSKRITISGYYGFGNTGDEAVLAGILESLKTAGVDAEVTALSIDPVATSRTHGILSAHRYKLGPLFRSIRDCDLFISGGGSLLQDVTSRRSPYYYLFVLRLAQMLGKKTMFYAQGVGPLISQRIRKATAVALNRTNAITVRDTESKTLLELIGVNKTPVEIAADPALLLQPEYSTADFLLKPVYRESDEIIGVSLRPWSGCDEKLKAISQGISQAARQVKATLVVVPMKEPDDNQVCSRIAEASVINCRDRFGAAKGVFGRCGLVVGMRLHSLIFAAGCVVPFVPVIYDPKVQSFADGFRQAMTIDVNEVTAQSAEQVVACAWDSRHDLRQCVAQHLPEARKLALHSAQIVAELLK